MGQLHLVFSKLFIISKSIRRQASSFCPHCHKDTFREVIFRGAAIFSSEVNFTQYIIFRILNFLFSYSAVFRLGIEPKEVTEDQVWQAKKLYDSAYHPDTGSLQFLPGRMSAQVPMNMMITGAMMTFYKLVFHFSFLFFIASQSFSPNI